MIVDADAARDPPRVAMKVRTCCGAVAAAEGVWKGSLLDTTDTKQ